MFVALPMLWMMIVPQIALAVETINTDETKIKFEIQKNSNIFNKIAMDEPVFKLDIAKSLPVEEPVKTPDEIKREKILDKWKAKQLAKWENLPEGKFIINASAYTAAADECGWNTGITASGLKVQENRTIACPPEYPFGAKVKIEGFGVFVCEDRGGAIKGNHFDIYMQTKKEAFTFGRRNLIAEVIS